MGHKGENIVGRMKGRVIVRVPTWGLLYAVQFSGSGPQYQTPYLKSWNCHTAPLALPQRGPDCRVGVDLPPATRALLLRTRQGPVLSGLSLNTNIRRGISKSTLSRPTSNAESGRAIPTPHPPIYPSSSFYPSSYYSHNVQPHQHVLSGHTLAVVRTLCSNLPLLLTSTSSGTPAPQQAASPFAPPSAPAATAGGGLFGASTTTTPAAPSGGLFGASITTTPTAPSGGLFGAAPQAPAASMGASLFSTPAATSAPATGGLFGTSTTPASSTGGGLFGGAGTAAPASNMGGLFGGGAATGSAGGGLLGQPAVAPTTGGLFGGQSTQQKPSLL